MPRCSDGQRSWLLVGLATALVAASWPAAVPAAEDVRQAAVQRLDRLPLLFVPEPGSPDGALVYAARGRQASVWVADRGLSFRIHPANGLESDPRSWVVALDLVGATPRQPVGADRLRTTVSYFTGPRARWRAGLASYGSVVLRDPWPGVDLEVTGTAGELKSSFVVRPGADPGAIRLAYRGATAVSLAPDGALLVDTPLGSIRELAPFAYQQIDGRRVEVAAVFELEPDGGSGPHGYRFRLGEYDPSRELIIDPVTLVYCGYIGGAGNDAGYAVAVDADGNAYVTGSTLSSASSFPVVVGPDLSANGNTDAFVAKVNVDGTALDYCGYIGGIGTDTGRAIAVDTAGNAYVTGDTASNQASFPVTVGPDLTLNGNADAFVAKVSATGASLDYCGYIGGSENDGGYGIAVDAAGNAYVVGGTYSDNLPVAVGPDLSFNGYIDAFVAKVNAAGTGLDSCGYLGGSDTDIGRAIAVDAAGSAYITGTTDSDDLTVTVGPDLDYNGSDDAFVAKVNASGSALVFSGYLGGSSLDHGAGIAVDASGNVHVSGYTISDETSFPVTVGPDLTYNGAYDAFVARVNGSGTGLDYCGYIGGAGNDSGSAIALDAAGNAYVTGNTKSDETTFPVTVGPGLTYGGGFNWGDAFVARVAVSGTGLDYCGYIGGTGDDVGLGIAVDGTGKAVVTGHTASAEASFPVTVGPDLGFNGGVDGFVVKVDFSDFFLDAVPAAVEICAGSDAQYTVDVGATGGFTAAVTLSAEGHPAGSGADFSLNPVAPPGSSVLTIGNTGGAAAGSYLITISGAADGSPGHSVGVTLDVRESPLPPTLTAPPDGAADQVLRPVFEWNAAADADSYTLEVDDDPAFASPEISVSGIAATSYATPDDLQEDTTYHWRVSSENVCGMGSASTVFSFTTIGQPTLPFSDGFESGDTSAWSATVP